MWRLFRNWGEYNASLKQRLSGAIWISSKAVENWTTDELTGEPGASPTYTDLAIEAMATVQAIYGLPGRQTQCPIVLRQLDNRPLESMAQYLCNKAVYPT